MRKNRIEKYYLEISAAFLGLIILFALLNIASIIGVKTYNYINKYHYGDENYAKAYPDKSIGEIHGILEETWPIKYSYEPYTQFKHKERTGIYVNVDKRGFRPVGNQCAMPLSDKNFNIFMFGGSTTFGVGVADDETISSRLQNKLNQPFFPKTTKVCVFNFGRAHYFSTQERIIFEKLMLDNNIPSMVIFFDGLNDFFYASADPKYTNRFIDYVEKEGVMSFEDFLGRFPFFKVINFILNTISEKNKDSRYKPEVISAAVERYKMNTRLVSALAADFNISTLFVVQPVPSYNYNLSYDVFSSSVNGLGFINAKYGYELLKKSKLSKNHLWLGDIQINKTENLYVDSAHYTTKFSDEIADEIKEAVMEDKRFINYWIENNEE
ncbi:SGNH/GDSL hydrolase family protein [Candidatus Woesearchaeota archaeon]|nr:SGNH/GDSL hydrolase family protein [Candidatus Woesearchaeota archaeon]